MVAEEEISDGELTDLLAEGGDAAFVSSRLRPSTLNRQHDVAERRHSRRIQSRTRTSRAVIPRDFFLFSQHVPKYLLRAAKHSQISAPHHSNVSSVSAGKFPAATSHDSCSFYTLQTLSVILCRRHEEHDEEEACNLNLNS